jgi:hypothetical protein
VTSLETTTSSGAALGFFLDHRDLEVARERAVGVEEDLKVVVGVEFRHSFLWETNDYSRMTRRRRKKADPDPRQQWKNCPLIFLQILTICFHPTA